MDIEQPQPASKVIPNWYKNMDSYIGGEKKPDGYGGTTATIKRCMPIFDSISAGYIIVSPADIHVSLQHGEQYFQWSALSLIEFHPLVQAPEYPNRKPHAYPKWMNPWAIKTPKGYSTLFVQPFHRESIFTILPGIVDTDTYTAPINFPMIINDSNFEGIIPQGTPIAQVIPFKRDNWKMEIGSEKELKEKEVVKQKLNTKFFDRYKSMFWSKKEYN
jgi:hypothetical protein